MKEKKASPLSLFLNSTADETQALNDWKSLHQNCSLIAYTVGWNATIYIFIHSDYKNKVSMS